MKTREKTEGAPSILSWAAPCKKESVVFGTRSDDAVPLQAVADNLAQKVASLEAQLVPEKTARQNQEDAIQSKLMQVNDRARETREKRSDDPAPLQVVVDNLAQQMNALKVEIAAQKSKLDSFGKMAAFHASISGNNVDVTAHGTIILPTVTTNIGNAYDPQSGFFTAPESGLYQFHATFMDANLNDYAHAGIYVGGNLVAFSLSDQRHNYFDVSSMAVIIHVTAGQKVYLRNEDSDMNRFYGSLFTTFSGFLIRAD